MPLEYNSTVHCSLPWNHMTCSHPLFLNLNWSITQSVTPTNFRQCLICHWQSCSHKWALLLTWFIIKTHVRGFFDTDLHGVSWHFATHKAVRPSGFYVQLTEWRSESKKPFKMGFCFYPTLRMQIQPLNYLKTVSKVGDLSSTIAMTAHCFGALSQVRAIGHCVILSRAWPT